MPRYEQMGLPGFELRTEQPDLPGFGANDEIEPSVSDMEESR